MKISLRAGEKIYVNGAVFSVDRRVSLQLLNDVTFLLESHVMQPGQATTPLRQVYFAIQMTLMDPSAAVAIRTSVYRMLDDLLNVEMEHGRRMNLQNICVLLESERFFEALRVARELYRSEEAHREQVGRTEKEATSQCN
ncbi:MAG: flagellar biosynthesis repressor FlbT [Methylobacteriaceae bacterium]|nr:flagellar biosynthesis repressor FlbT [Methylobacteriaceae bacterium]